MLSCAHPGAPADSAHPGAPADSGLAGCTSLSATHHVSAADYPKIRAQFAGSHWPDLRTAGTAYADLVVQLRTARGTDGYDTVSVQPAAGRRLRQARTDAQRQHLTKHLAARPSTELPSLALGHQETAMCTHPHLARQRHGGMPTPADQRLMRQFRAPGRIRPDAR